MKEELSSSAVGQSSATSTAQLYGTPWDERRFSFGLKIARVQSTGVKTLLSALTLALLAEREP
jgi:hypothetical protein